MKEGTQLVNIIFCIPATRFTRHLLAGNIKFVKFTVYNCIKKY